MSDHFEDPDDEMMLALKASVQALEEFAVRQGWEIDIRPFSCENCGESHIEEGWIWGQDGDRIGIAYADFDFFTVFYDENQRDDDSQIFAWDCEELEEVDLLVSMLKQRFSL